MDKYQSTHTGSEIDTAVDKVLNEELPIASSTKLGGIKVGDNLSITSDGVLSASGGGSGGGTKLYKHRLKIKGSWDIVDKPYGNVTKSVTKTLLFWIIDTNKDTYSVLSDFTDNGYYGKVISIYGCNDDDYSGDEENSYMSAYTTTDWNRSGYNKIGGYSIYYDSYIEIKQIDVTSFTDTVTEL